MIECWVLPVGTQFDVGISNNFALLYGDLLDFHFSYPADQR